jgi:hypothetical protein
MSHPSQLAKTVHLEFDDAMNEAGWVMLDNLRDLGVELTPEVFNGLKGKLKDAIEVYLTHKEVYSD